MKFAKMIDLGNTLEISVDGLGALELVTPNVLRSQYYTCHAEFGAGCEKRLAVALRWDTSQWLAAWTQITSMGPARLLDALPMLDAKMQPMMLGPALN